MPITYHVYETQGEFNDSKKVDLHFVGDPQVSWVSGDKTLRWAVHRLHDTGH